MNDLYLGVDGGQSSTTALIGDSSGRVLGVGVGGPCNHVGAAEGRRKLTGAVTDCVGKACAAAGLDGNAVRFRAACFGMSGGPDDKQAILAEILRADKLVVTHDGMIALAGAMAGGGGIITIAGTGSFTFARNEVRTARVGGWGYVFGDEGGGFDLTRQAVRAALRFEEGWGPRTVLHPRLIAATESRNANDLLHKLYTQEWPRPRVAALSQLVDQAAVEGDSVAVNLLNQAAQQLAQMAASARAQLWKPGEPVSVAYIGGVFRSRMLLERYRALVELIEGNKAGPPKYGPAAGALLEAYRAGGLRPELKELPEFKT